MLVPPGITRADRCQTIMRLASLAIVILFACDTGADTEPLPEGGQWGEECSESDPCADTEDEEGRVLMCLSAPQSCAYWSQCYQVVDGICTFVQVVG